MSFYKEYQGGETKYKIVGIEEQNLPELECELRRKLVQICHGIKKPKNCPEEYSYRKVCSNMVDILNSKTDRQKYGLIGELLMHLVVPEILSDRQFESISLLASLTDRNVKHGFDLNFYEAPCKKIWYGEVKSGVGISRVKLIDRAKKGLLDYFDGLLASGLDNTSSRWEAAKNEVLVKYYDDRKGIKLFELLSSSKNSIERNDGGKNAIMMAVVYGKEIGSSELLDFSDVEETLKKYIERALFDDLVIVVVHKKIYDDIIKFLEKERLEDE